MTDRERLGSKLPARATALAAALAASVGFAAIYVTLGRSDNAARTPAPPILQAQATAPAPAAREDASGPAAASWPPSSFARNRRLCPKSNSKTATAENARSPSGAVRWCFSIFGRPGVCRVVRRCPRSTGCKQTLGSDQFQVVAISVDRTGLAGAKKFLEETKTPSLAVYADSTARLASSLQGRRPARHLADRQGGPRDRPAAGSRRMGRRGRSAPDPVRPSLGARARGAGQG